MYHFANVRIVVVSNTALLAFNSINMVTLQIINYIKLLQNTQLCIQTATFLAA